MCVCACACVRACMRVLCVCACVVTHRNHSHQAPLHVSLFIPQSFGHLTETNDSASEMSSSPAHKQVERDGERERALQSGLVPLFSVWPRTPA